MIIDIETLKKYKRKIEIEKIKRVKKARFEPVKKPRIGTFNGKEFSKVNNDSVLLMIKGHSAMIDFLIAELIKTALNCGYKIK